MKKHLIIGKILSIIILVYLFLLCTDLLGFLISQPTNTGLLVLSTLVYIAISYFIFYFIKQIIKTFKL